MSRQGAAKSFHRSVLGRACASSLAGRAVGNQRTRSAESRRPSSRRRSRRSGEGEPAQSGVLEALDVLFNVGVGADHQIQVTGVAVAVGVEPPVAVSIEGNRLRCAPGWSGSRRTISRVPSGSLGSLIRTVSSATTVPVSSFTILASADCQTASEAFACRRSLGDLRVLARGTRRSRCCAPDTLRGTLGASGRIGTHDHLTADQAGVVAGPMTDAISTGSWAIAWSSTVTWSATVFAPGVAWRATCRQGLAGGVRETEHRMEPVPALERRRRRLLVLRVHLDQRRVDVQITGRCPSWPLDRDHTYAAHLGHRPATDARTCRGDLGERSVQRRVRRDRPEQPGRAADPRCPSSTPRPRRASTPPGRGPCPGHGQVSPPMPGHRRRDASPSPNRSANAPSECNPTWATAPPHRVPPSPRQVLLPFTLEVPFCCATLPALNTDSFPRQKGFSVDAAPIRSIGAVKNQG